MQPYFSKQACNQNRAGFRFGKKNGFPGLGITFFLVFSFTLAGPFYFSDKVFAGECPQPRFTEKAPAEFLEMANPLENTAENLKKGKMLYQIKAKPMPCKHCHGVEGDGKGPMSGGFKPPPRNFTCKETINGVPDGQLFWIIQNGSPGTGMMAFKRLKEEQIWQVILYLRELAAN